METHIYNTIEAPSTGEYKEKGSKFLAYAFPISNRDEVKQHLDQLKKDHFKSRHVCFAYRIGADGSDYRQSDDGEPSGTAGRPILGQIDSFELTNLLVAVVRYFGGTKLGVSGLIHAYKSAAMDALNNASKVTKTVDVQLEIMFDYHLTGPVMSVLNTFDIQPASLEYHTGTTLTVVVPISIQTEFLLHLKSNASGRPVEDLDENTDIDGLTIRTL